MKRNLLRLVMLFVTTVLTNSAFAQSSMLATLNHEGTISAYYGVSALKDAYEAATEFVSRTSSELDDLLSQLGGKQGALNTLEKLEQAEEKAANELSAFWSS